MPNVRFIPRDEVAKVRWLRHFAATARPFAVQLEIPLGWVDQLEADARVYDHLHRTRAALDSYSQALTAWRDVARSGSQLSEFPPLPALEPPPPGAKPGIFKRAAKLATLFKINRGYAEHMGVAMGLIAPKKAPVDLTTVQPEIRVLARPGMPVVVKWKKGRMRALEIHVNRGDGKFVYLNIDTQPDFIDTTPLPPRGVAVIWTYKAIFVGDDQVKLGRWSPEVSVTVTG